MFGNVTDFDCGEGETPWGGHGVVEVVVDEAAAVVETAIEGAIEAVVDSGGSLIEADPVVEAIQVDFADEIPDTIEDEFEEFPACDYLQDRFLDGQGTTTVTVDTKRKIARITGTLTVTAGGHGEPSGVLARLRSTSRSREANGRNTNPRTRCMAVPIGIPTGRRVSDTTAAKWPAGSGDGTHRRRR